jgi:hypothetical protein
MKILTPKEYRRATWIGIAISMIAFPFTIIALAIVCDYFGIRPELPKNYDFYTFWTLLKNIFYTVSRIIFVPLILYGGFLFIKVKESRRQVITSVIIIFSFLLLSWVISEASVPNPNGFADEPYDFLQK